MSKGLLRSAQWAVGLALVLGLYVADAAAWQFTADFESGAVGNLAQGPSGFQEAGSLTTFSSENAHSGSKSAKMVWQYNTSGFGTAMGTVPFPAAVPVGGELWMRGYYYFVNPWSWQAASGDECACAIKTARAHVRNAAGGHVGYTSVITNNFGIPYVNCETCNGLNGLNVPTSAAAFTAGRWYAVELYTYFHPTNGVVRMWIDGELKAEATNIATAQSGSDLMDSSYWMGYWNGRVGQDQVMYVDDVVVTTDTPAGRDRAGNPMIGLGAVSGGGAQAGDQTIPAPPVNLRVQP